MSVVCSAPCSHQYNLRIHWRHSTIWGTSKKSVWSNVFWYLKVYIFWKYIQYTIHWDKKIFKKISSGKINGTKTVLFFLSRALTRQMISAWVGAPQNWPGDKCFKPRKSKFWERLNSNFLNQNEILVLFFCFFRLISYPQRKWRQCCQSQMFLSIGPKFWKCYALFFFNYKKTVFFVEPQFS